MIRFDHALVYVKDLPGAVRDYAALGFTVVPGGAHDRDPTENALVAFADGSYLELIAFRRRATRALLGVLSGLGLVGKAVRSPLARRFALRAAAGSGLIDFAVGVDAVSPIVERARRAGVTIHGPVAGRRAAADGPIVWDLGIPAAAALPLVIADVTPRDRRVATTSAIAHRNGATGVTRIVVPVDEVTRAAALYRDVLGLDAVAEGRGVAIRLGATTLMLEPMARSSI
jgi:catechol 2,3-dioxygenase-like lactoylglutathione lyase family enzyme